VKISDSKGPDTDDPTYTGVEIQTKAGFLGNMAINPVSNCLEVEARSSTSSVRDKGRHSANHRNTKFPHDNHVSSECPGIDRASQAIAGAKGSRFRVSDL
jgi:hypothetical protein